MKSNLKDTLDFINDNKFSNKIKIATKEIDNKIYNLLIFCDMNIGSKHHEGAAELDLSMAKVSMLSKNDEKEDMLNTITSLVGVKERIREAIKLNPNRETFVVLGGNLFTSQSKHFSYDQQLDALVELFEPIKSKIILAIDGTQESNKNVKYPENLTQALCKRLGISSVYSPNKCGFFNIKFKNINGTCFVQRNFVTSIKSNALTFGTEGNNAQKTIPDLSEIDNAFVTCSNSTALVCKAKTKIDEKTGNSMKHGTNIAFCGGEKEYKRVPANKYLIKNYSIGYIYSVSAENNKDSTFLISKDGIGSEPIKSHINSLYPFYYDFTDSRVIDITKFRERAEKNNEVLADWAIDVIKKMCVEINKENAVLANKDKAKIEEQSGIANYFKKKPLTMAINPELGKALMLKKIEETSKKQKQQANPQKEMSNKKNKAKKKEQQYEC